MTSGLEGQPCSDKFCLGREGRIINRRDDGRRRCSLQAAPSPLGYEQIFRMANYVILHDFALTQIQLMYRI